MDENILITTETTAMSRETQIMTGITIQSEIKFYNSEELTLKARKILYDKIRYCDINDVKKIPKLNFSDACSINTFN